MIPKNGKYIKNGNEIWYQDNKVHRTDGPAIIRADGTQYWYQNDKIHRTDGPAVICVDGAVYWCQNGKLHRTDGPAVIYADGTGEYWLNDEQVDVLVWLVKRESRED